VTAPVPCDVLVRAAAVITMDPAAPLLRDAAIVVTDGVIVACGAAAALEAQYVPARQAGSAQAIALPGLVNTHNHSPLMIVRGAIEDQGFAPAYTPGVPQGDVLSAEEAYLLARLGLYEMLRFGSTTVVDFYRHPEALARAMVESGLRGFVGGRIMDADTAALASGAWRAAPARGVATRDEAFGFATAWQGRHPMVTPLLAPHAADTCSAGLLREVAALADATGMLVHTHMHQSQMEVDVVLARDGCRPVELFEQTGLLNPKLIAGHCIWMDAADIARFGAAGAAVAHAPIGNAAHGAIAPILALAAAGAAITLATDTKSGDMFQAMRVALMAARIRGAGFRVGSEAMLRWATVDGAAALGLGGVVGVIRPGYRADVVLLDGDAPNLCPLTDPAGLVVHNAVGPNVDTVLIDGVVVLEGGLPTLFDGAEVVRSAAAVAERLWARAA
jgi:5-methylthioadenosine/S-adenosylhomocysteine deaminase